MADVLTSARFNELFTIYVNDAGEAVQRTLAKMTADEVLAAIEWQNAEADRLERESAPFAEMAKIVENGGDLPAETSRQALQQAITVLRQAAEANTKGARLMELVRANIPQWRRRRNMNMGAAVRRFWPGGR